MIGDLMAIMQTIALDIVMIGTYEVVDTPVRQSGIYLYIPLCCNALRSTVHCTLGSTHSAASAPNYF